MSAAVAALAFGPVAPAVAAPAPTPAATADSEPEKDSSAPSSAPRPIDFAVVVDESGSIQPDDLANETAAASLLSQSELAPESRAVVIGFGSSNRAGQTPVDEVCSLTALDTAGRQRLSSCVRKLHSRTAAEGDGTDLPAAIQQAVSRLTSAPGPARPRILFLLTDGKLDVPDSPQYGPAGDRNAVAETVLRTSALPAARKGKVQIWPLGFGDGIDSNSLEEIAAGGYQSRCADLPGATPRATIVAGSGAVARSLQQAFAAARCAQVGPIDEGVPPTDLFVQIPPIATDGSITVVKRDARVVATYFDPNGHEVPRDGAFDGSMFDLSGQDGPVESLRIKDPLPGRWRVKLTTPAGGGGQLVSTSALWQGVLRSSISMNPPQPVPGERTSVAVRLQTRRGVVITDPADLAGIRVSIRLTGTGFSPVALALADDGRAPDAKAGDGVFGGSLAVPENARGAISLVGSVVAEGITGDQRRNETILNDRPSTVTASPVVEDRQAYRGEVAHGRIVVRNNDTRPHTLTLSLADVDDTRQVDVSPSSVEVQPGSQEPVPFTLTFGGRSPLGETTGRIVVTDQTADGRELGSTFLTVMVLRHPSWPVRYWPLLAGAAALLVLLVVLAVLRRRAVAHRRDPNGLALQLLRDDTVVAHWQVRVPHPDGFGFVVTGEGPRTTLREQSAGARYLLFRRGSGAALRTPAGATTQVTFGNRVGLGSGPDLVVLGDPRRPGRSTGRPDRRGSRTGRRTAERSRDNRERGSREGTEPRRRERVADHPHM